MSGFPPNSAIVLVSGAWADGSCWRNVILPLQREGLDVVCAPIPLTSLSNDIEALEQVLERTSGPLVLAGHAYGGAVIAGATNDRVRALVFVAGLAPAKGETVAQVFYRNAPDPEALKLAPDRHGRIWMPRDGFRQAVAHLATADQISLMASQQRPIAVACIQEPAPEPRWKAAPSWYLVAEEDRMLSPATQRFMAARMGAKVRAHGTDHTPMYTRPTLVIDALLEAARENLTGLADPTSQSLD